MFIVVLLIARVGAEWVEISQNNWNRPQSPRLKQTENVQYLNQSLNQWKRGAISKVSLIGNVRKVPYASVKTPSMKPNLDSTESRPVVWKSSPSKIRPQSAEDNEHSEHEFHLNDNPDILRIKTNPLVSSNVDSQVKNGDRKVNNLRSPDRLHVKGESGGSQRIYIEEIIQSSSDRNAIINPFVESSVKPKKGDEKLKLLYKDNPSTGDWMNTTVSEENKMERVWAAVKLVTATISKQSRKGFKSKVRYLEDLKDSITSSIEGHIDRLWPDDGKSGRYRRSSEARGHVEVPSSEGALMTISFLTFAVFLIKLVLQVIHAYKQKAMMVTPAVLAAVGRTSGTYMKNLH